jgi:branched-chain amino acid transport system substrate-binding protein
MKDALKRYAVKTRSSLSMVAVVVMILAGLSACSQSTSTTPTFTNQTPITIGASISTSGDFKNDGAAVAQGYQLWMQTVNNNGGLLGRPVKFVFLHDDSTPQKVLNNYNMLIRQYHVDLVVGPFSTLLTKAAARAAASAGYAFIEGSGGGPSVYDLKLHNLFAVSVPVANNLLSFAYYILSLPQDQRPKTAAYATSDDPFTQPQLQVAENLLSHSGVTTVYDNTGNPYSADDPNYVKKYIPGVAEQVVKSHAQVVILGTQFPDVQAYIAAFKKEHYNPKAIIATAGPDAGQSFVSAVGGVKYTEGVFVPNGWYPQVDNFQNAQMVHDYLARYGGTADAINADVAEAYSVGQVLEQAVTAIHSIDNAQLIDELHKDVFNTVQGTAQFDQIGKNTSALAYLFQWQGGSFIPVYPSSAAAENPEFPRPRNY